MKARITTTIVLALIGACTSLRQAGSPAERFVLGSFTDDYDASHVISATEWRHGSRALYHIVKWNAADEYLIARNDSANPSDPGLWTRIDWVRLDGMPPWTWGYCMSAYKAPTADSAESTRIANRTTPRTGCNGFPFTRMRSTAPSRNQGFLAPPTRF